MAECSNIEDENGQEKWFRIGIGKIIQNSK